MRLRIRQLWEADMQSAGSPERGMNLSPDAVLKATAELRELAAELTARALRLADFAFKWAANHGGVPELPEQIQKLVADYQKRFPRQTASDEKAIQQLAKRYEKWAKANGVR